MTSYRTRLLTLLNGGRPDRVPWFGDLDYLATSWIEKGEKPRDFKSSSEYLDMHRELRVGFYLQGYFPFEFEIEGCETKEWSDGSEQYRSIKTPHGTLRECWRKLPESFTIAPVEHLIKGEEDLKAYRHIYEKTRFRPSYELAERRNRQIGELGINLCYAPRSPFMRLAVMDAGIETVTMLALDAERELENTLKTMKEALDSAVEISCNSPTEAVMIPENLSSEMIGKMFFERYMREIQEEWVGRITDAGKYSFIHIDGSLKGLLSEESKVGFTVLEALTPAPVGDLDVEEWHSFCESSSSIFWGGIPGSYFTPRTSREELERHVVRVLQTMRKRPRFVLGVADQVPPNADVSRITRVGELVEEHGAYE